MPGGCCYQGCQNPVHLWVCQQYLLSCDWLKITFGSHALTWVRHVRIQNFCPRVTGNLWSFAVYTVPESTGIILLLYLIHLSKLFIVKGTWWGLIVFNYIPKQFVYLQLACSLWTGWQRVFAWCMIALKLAAWCVIETKLAVWCRTGHNIMWCVIFYFTSMLCVIYQLDFHDK